MISTYKAIRWFRASRSRKLGHVLVARDRLVLGAETDWVTRGYKFRILEFCLGDPVPPPALDSVPHNGTYLSYPRNLSWPTIMSVRTKIESPFDRSLRHSLLHLQWNERIPERKVWWMKIGYTSIDNFRLESNHASIELCDSRSSRYKTCMRVIICWIDFSTTRVFNERELHEK